MGPAEPGKEPPAGTEPETAKQLAVHTNTTSLLFTSDTTLVAGDAPLQNPEQAHKDAILQLARDNTSIFKKALEIFEANATKDEKKWLWGDTPAGMKKRGKYSTPKDNKPPESLEALVEFLYDAHKRIKNSGFEKVYAKAKGCQGALRHFGIVVDSVIKFVPEPALTPVGAAFGLIKFVLGFIQNHHDLVETMASDITYIFGLIESSNWWLSAFQKDPIVCHAAVDLYVKILVYLCETWGILQEKRSVLDHIRHSSTKSDEFNNLVKEIKWKGEQVQTAGLVVGFMRVTDSIAVVLSNQDKALVTQYKVFESQEELSRTQRKILDAHHEMLEAQKKILDKQDKILDKQDELSEKEDEVLRNQERDSRLATVNSIRQLVRGATAKQRKRLKEMSGKRYPGTCTWAFKNEDISGWFENPKQTLLWIHDIPGAGKSVAAAYLIENVIEHRIWMDRGGTSLYFFCEYTNVSQGSASEIVKSLVLQILENMERKEDLTEPSPESREMLKCLKALDEHDYSDICTGVDDTTRERFLALFRTLSKQSPVWVVIDGLDEYDSATTDALFNFMSAVCGDAGVRLRVIVFSRPEPEIKSSINLAFAAREGQPEVWRQMVMPSTSDDVRAFARHEVAMVVAAKYTGNVEGFQAQQTERILDKLLHVEVDEKSPIFLWVAEVIKSMADPKATVATIDELLELKYTPNALYTIYARIIMRIEMTNLNSIDFLKFMRGILCWAVYGLEQPLKMSTLEVIARGSFNAVQIRDLIDANCSSLFVWRGTSVANDTLHFIHLSVKEFLSQSKLNPENREAKLREYCSQANFPIYKAGEFGKSTFQGKLLFGPEQAHRRIFNDSIRYLSKTTAFSQPLVATRGDAVRKDWIETDHPFFAYAGQNWQYHLVESGGYEASASAAQLQEFLGGPNRDTWMEGAIALCGGVERVRNQNRPIEDWLKKQNLWSTAFDNWSCDIADGGFQNYEPTLRYNPNDIHALDRKTLFSRLIPTKDYVHPRHDVLCELRRALAKDSSNSSAPKHFRVGDIYLPNERFPYGESDGDYGFFQLDRNSTLHQGMLMIDRHVNDPRLLWNCMNPAKSVEQAKQKDDEDNSVKLESTTTKPVKAKGNEHMLWRTLCGALNWPGSMAVAVFAETVHANEEEGKPAHIRLKPVKWVFEPGNKELWEEWETTARENIRIFKEATQHALDLLHPPDPRHHAGVGAYNSAAKAAEEACKTMHDTLLSRPPLPTAAPLFKGKDWAVCSQLYEHSDVFRWSDDLLESRYLLAFRDDGRLITYKGIWDFERSGYAKRYTKLSTTVDGFAKLDRGFTVVPGGDDILRFLSPDVLEIVDALTEGPRAAVSIRSLGAYNRFGAIIDCSSSGRLVAVSLEDDATNSIGLVVIDLYQCTFKLIVPKKPRVHGFRFDRVFFCPADVHAVVTYSRQDIEAQSGAYLVDIPGGACSEMDIGDHRLASVVYSTCECATTFRDISEQCLRGSESNTHIGEPGVARSSTSHSHLPRRSTRQFSKARLRSPDMQAMINGGDWSDEDEIEEEPVCCADHDLCARRGHIRAPWTVRQYFLQLKEGTLEKALSNWKPSPERVRDQQEEFRMKCGTAGIVFSDRRTAFQELAMVASKLVYATPVAGVPDLGQANKPGIIRIRRSACRPSFSTLKDVAAAYLYAEAVPIGDEPHQTIVKCNVSWSLWNLQPSSCTALSPPGRSILLNSVQVIKAALVHCGVAISPKHTALAIWVGPFLWFVSTQDSSLRALDVDKNPEVDARISGLNCLDFRFSPSKGCAIGAWGRPQNPDAPTKDTKADFIVLYRLSKKSDKVVVGAAIQVSCYARWYAFHPAWNVVAVTTASGVLLIDYTNMAAPRIVRNITKEEVEKGMRVPFPKRDQGKASPPSTRETQFKENEDEQAPLYFSECGSYLFSRTWDQFADLFELVEDPMLPPRYESVLRSFKQDFVQRGTPWKSIHTDHPRVMYEGVLYAAGQHRFKIFRIRTYIVLAWAADGRNLYEYPVPFVDSQHHEDRESAGAGASPSMTSIIGTEVVKTSEAKDDNPPTWYRRVLCAISLPYANWTATLIWPATGESRLIVVLFPPNPQETVAPTLLFCPDTVNKLDPDETQTEVHAGHVVHTDGWIRSHAAGCAFHLRV